MSLLVYVNGWKRSVGVLVLLATAFATAKSIRFGAFFALACLAYLPGMITYTSFGRTMRTLSTKLAGVLTWPMLIASCVLIATSFSHQPFTLRMPGKKPMQAIHAPIFPVGAVDYLKEHNFAGNVLVGYNHGSYVSWKLGPSAKVFIDSRYEVAYPSKRIDEETTLFEARDGWQKLLELYPHDIILAETQSPLATKLADHASWRRVYADNAFVIFAKPEVKLPTLSTIQPDRDGTYP